MYSNQPGLQLYSAHGMNEGFTGKDGSPIIQDGGVCLETQAWPNAINNPDARDRVLLQPGKTYRSKTVWVLK